MILSFAIWIPIFFGLIILFYGSEKPTAGVRWLALVGSVIGFIATLPLIIQFDIANPGMQFVEKISWIPRYDINYHLGIDGISVCAKEIEFANSMKIKNYNAILCNKYSVQLLNLGKTYDFINIKYKYVLLIIYL